MVTTRRKFILLSALASSGCLRTAEESGETNPTSSPTTASSTSSSESTSATTATGGTQTEAETATNTPEPIFENQELELIGTSDVVGADRPGLIDSIADDLFVAHSEGTISRVNLQGQKWRSGTSSEFNGWEDEGRLSVSGNSVIVSGSQTLRSVRADNGTEQWDINRPGISRYYRIYNDSIIAPFYDRRDSKFSVIKVNRETGDIIWELDQSDFDARTDYYNGISEVRDGKLWLSIGTDVFEIQIDEDSEPTPQKVDSVPHFDAPAKVREGQLIARWQSRISVYDITVQEALWEFDTGRYGEYFAPTINNGNLYIAVGPEIHSYHLRDGRQNWKVTVPSQVPEDTLANLPIALYNSVIWVGTVNGIAGIAVDRGNKVIEYSLPSSGNIHNIGVAESYIYCDDVASIFYLR